jgi:hypothetical protein
LSVTRDRGISEPEAIAHLERSALADYSRPVGTFFFTSTSDVRTKAREPNFAMAVERLRAMKLDAKIIEQPLPGFGQQCSGVMFGLADFDWPRTGATLLPGSIAESLTSLGGAMTTESQTKATELLRHGAAASSGAVTEPFSIQNKFPHPMMHVHYARGLTCAEAYYASVLCPYQLLIVGDPLCQPFAEPPRFEMSGIQNFAQVSGTLPLRLRASEDEHTVDPVRLTWLVDGAPKTESPFQNEIRIQVAGAEKGAQEWRLIAKGPKPLEHRCEQALWVVAGDLDAQVSLQAPSSWSRSDGKTLQLEIKNAPTEGTIAIRHDWEIVARQPVSQTVFAIDPAAIGFGPARLQAVVLDAEGNVTRGSLPATVTMTK